MLRHLHTRAWSLSTLSFLTGIAKIITNLFGEKAISLICGPWPLTPGLIAVPFRLWFLALFRKHKEAIPSKEATLAAGASGLFMDARNEQR